MLLRTLPIACLKPAPYNPRKPLRPGSAAYRRLAKSLDAFDLVQPIVWNERTGHVVSGHQRLALLQDRGDREVGCVVVDLPLDKEKALNIALNNSAIGSDWDHAKLHDLLEELTELPDFDATITGFDEQELKELVLNPVAAPAPLPPDDSTNAVRVTLIVPRDQWSDVHAALDRLLQAHAVELHVTLPR